MEWEGDWDGGCVCVCVCEHVKDRGYTVFRESYIFANLEVRNFFSEFTLKIVGVAY